MAGKYIIELTDPYMRYRINVVDEVGNLLLVSQLRELKAMSFNEVRWIRGSGMKDNSYIMFDGEGSYSYQLVANDGHLLGKSSIYPTKALRDEAFEKLKSIVADAVLEDETPNERHPQDLKKILHKCAIDAMNDPNSRFAC